VDPIVALSFFLSLYIYIYTHTQNPFTHIHTGVDTIVCVSRLDPYAMQGWVTSLGDKAKGIDFYSDDTAKLTEWVLFSLCVSNVEVLTRIERKFCWEAKQGHRLLFKRHRHADRVGVPPAFLVSHIEVMTRIERYHSCGTGFYLLGLCFLKGLEVLTCIECHY